MSEENICLPVRISGSLLDLSLFPCFTIFFFKAARRNDIFLLVAYYLSTFLLVTTTLLERVSALECFDYYFKEIPLIVTQHHDIFYQLVFFVRLFE